jgi:hypothetical protein
MSPVEISILILIGVAVLGFAMRVLGRSTENAAADGEISARDAVDELLDEVSSGSEVVALSSDGVAFVPAGDAVHLIPSGDPEEVIPTRATTVTDPIPSTDPETAALLGRGAPINPRTGRRLMSWSPGHRFDPGDLIGARVVRGAPDFDPWRLETLGRDAEYMAWPFETEEAAHAARDLFESRIVRAPEDEDGNPRPPSAADFAEARRRDEETERALDAPDPLE